jgi:hypothetical protein
VADRKDVKFHGDMAKRYARATSALL